MRGQEPSLRLREAEASPINLPHEGSGAAIVNKRWRSALQINLPHEGSGVDEEGRMRGPFADQPSP